jgi:large subunit ribosomal protein L31
MKDDIHPNYRPVVFKDASCGFTILTRSTVRTNQTIKWEDGKEYPLVTVDVSSASHPYYTGTVKFVDTAGRVDKFNKKFQGTYGKGKKKNGEAAKS